MRSPWGAVRRGVSRLRPRVVMDIELWDTHTHLQDESFAGDRDAVCARAREHGVGRFVLVSVDPRDFTRVPALAAADPRCVPALGIHPLRLRDEAAAAAAVPALLDALGAAVAAHRPRAVGEIGLDREAGQDDAQTELFRGQLALARELDVPVLLHCRRRFGELVRVLRRDGLPGRGGIYHAFSGSAEMAAEIAALGLRAGIGGTVTYSNAQRLRSLVAQMPQEAFVLETDCPDLAPEPYRGRRNEPAYLVEVFRTVCEARGASPERLAKALAQNCRALFENPLS